MNEHKEYYSSLMKYTRGYSETEVKFYQNTRCHIAEDCSFHSDHRENLKSYQILSFFLTVWCFCASRWKVTVRNHTGQSDCACGSNILLELRAFLISAQKEQQLPALTALTLEKSLL